MLTDSRNLNGDKHAHYSHTLNCSEIYLHTAVSYGFWYALSLFVSQIHGTKKEGEKFVRFLPFRGVCVCVCMSSVLWSAHFFGIPSYICGCECVCVCVFSTIFSNSISFGIGVICIIYELDVHQLSHTKRRIDLYYMRVKI